MKNIILKRAEIIGFKRILNLTINFTNTTNILGENGTGKSTVYDAICWVLFGKDSHDKQDFEIKFLKPDRTWIPKQDHSVTLFFDIDGVPLELKKVYSDQWITPRGESEEIYKGNVTDCFIDGIGKSATEYNKFIESIVNQEIFKLITNPEYFPSLEWKIKRDILFEICGLPTDKQIIDSNSEFAFLNQVFAKGHTIDDYIKKLNTEIKGSKTVKGLQPQIDAIPIRIAENDRDVPMSLDFDGIRTQITIKQQAVNELDNQLTNLSGVFENYKRQQSEIGELEIQLNKIIVDDNILYENQRQAKQNEIFRLQNQKSQIELQIKLLQDGLSDKQKSLAKMVSDKAELLVIYKTKISEQFTDDLQPPEFTDDMAICPTCRQSLPDGDVEAKKAEMLKNFEIYRETTIERFNEEKLKSCNDILKIGKTMAANIEKIEKEISDQENQIQDKQIELATMETLIGKEQQNALNVDKIDITTTESYKALQNQINAKTLELKQPTADTSGIIEQKKIINIEIDNLKSQLLIEEKITSIQARRIELLSEEKILQVKKAELEKQVDICKRFTKTKVDLTEGTVNNLFKKCQIYFSKIKIDGTTEPWCEIFVEGVPYESNLNTGAKVVAGVEIAQVLAKYYGIKAPVFIDNHESVTEEIFVDGQRVCLFANKEYKELEIISA